MEELKGIVEEIERVKGVIEEIKDRETILESRVKTCIEEHNELKGVIKELESEISSVKEGNLFVDSKVDAEISEIQKLESLIKKVEGEVLQQNFKLRSEIEGLKWQQESLSSKIGTLEFKKAVEELDNLIEEKNKFFAEVGKVVEKIEDIISSLLSLTVQLNFGYNFIGFIVQYHYHSTCGNWWIFFVLTAVILFFLGSNIFFSWRRVYNSLTVVEYLCRDGESLKYEFCQLNVKAIPHNIDIESIISDIYWPNPTSIRKKYVNRFLGIIGCVGAHCILVSIGCHFLFCGKSNVLGPLLSGFISNLMLAC